VLKYIARRSDNAAGDLILGNDSYARYLASLAAQEAAVLTEQERMQRYPQMADDAMQGDAPGSSALDGDLGMMDRNWTAVAQELGRLGVLPQDDVITVELLDLFGALIGNTDKHHGNIAVRWTLERQHRLLEAYDMLPMLYRPNAHGEIVERAWKPDYLGNVALRHLSRCHGMALEFWHDVLQDTRISADFKTVANNHLRAIQPLATANSRYTPR